jgi:hypothetical protein
MAQSEPAQGLVETRPLPGFADHELAGSWGEVGDDRESGLAFDEHPSHRARITDPKARLPASSLRGRAVRKIGRMALLGVEDGPLEAPKQGQKLMHHRHDPPERSHVVPERLAEAAGLDEVALHVDDDKPEVADGALEIVGLCGDGRHLRACEKIVASEGRSRSAGAQETAVYVEIHEDSEHRRNERSRAQQIFSQSLSVRPWPGLLPRDRPSQRATRRRNAPRTSPRSDRRGRRPRPGPRRSTKPPRRGYGPP